MSFIEILVAVVLLGIAGVAVLTSMSVSVRGSDQHRSKVAAVSELQGAGAYLAREAFNTTCASTPADLNAVLANRDGATTQGITITVDGVTCVAGLPVVALTATHAKGHAVESLSVTVGGISVLKPGTGAGPGPGPGPGPCTWGTASALPVSINKSGNKLAQPVTIKIAYTGDCSTATVSATMTSGSASFSRPMTDQGGLFQVTLATNEVNWNQYGLTLVSVVANAVQVGTTQFTVT
jgi:type II secretory pathway pseudopilin PulG